MKQRRVILLSIGHAVTDINQGSLPALLPFLIAEYGLSYAAAAFIVFSANVASTIVQPLFGHLADRVAKPWLLPASVLAASAGVAMIGVVSDYRSVLLAAVVSGIGVAAYHPEGARRVHVIAGEQKAMAMSVFGIGGTVGFAVGPPLTTLGVLQWGMRGTLIVLVPACLAAFALARASWAPAPGTAGTKPAPGTMAAPRDRWAAFSRLSGLVVARATLFYGFNTFVPLYVLNVLHGSKASGATALTLFALAGVGGNLLGGKLADRLGYVRIAFISFCLLIPLIPALLWAPSVPMAIGVLVLIGGALSSSYSPLVILGQRYLPNHIGLSSGVTLGIAVAIGGVAAPILGRLADLYGLWTALAVTAILPLLSAALALTLPRPSAG